MNKTKLLIAPLLVVPLLASCNGGSTEYKIDVPDTNGVIVTPQRATKGKDYAGTIRMATDVDPDHLLPDALTKVTSGNKELQPKEYTYTLKEDKLSADLKIPAANVVGDVTIQLTLVDKPQPTPTKDTCTVTWDLGYGTTIKEEYKVGEMPSYKGETPSKPDDTEYDEDGMKYHYTFDGWEETISPVAKDVTYHTHYIKESLFMVIRGYISQQNIDSNHSKYHIDELWNTDEEAAWDVDWGDGDMSIDHDKHEHTYTTPGTKIIKIHNKCTSIHFNCDDPEHFAFSKMFLKEVTIPYGVERIPSSLETTQTAMFDSTKMNKVTFPSSLVSLTNVFCNNGETVDPANIGEIILPSNLKIIEQNAFTGIGTYKLPVIVPNTVVGVQSNAFFDAEIGRLVLPKSIKSYPSKSLQLSDKYHTIDMTDYDVAPDIVEDTFKTDPESLFRILVKDSAYESFLTKWADFNLERYIVVM